MQIKLTDQIQINFAIINSLPNISTRTARSLGNSDRRTNSLCINSQGLPQSAHHTTLYHFTQITVLLWQIIDSCSIQIELSSNQSTKKYHCSSIARNFSFKRCFLSNLLWISNLDIHDYDCGDQQRNNP